MRKNDYPEWVARARIEPVNHDELLTLFHWIKANHPDEINVPEGPDENHNAAFIYLTPFKAKDYEKATWRINWAIKRKIVKPSGVPIKSYAVQVYLADADTTDFPENWQHPGDWKELTKQP